MSFLTADEIDLLIPYGLTWSFNFQLTDQNGAPEDITGYSIGLQMRANGNDEAAVLTLTSNPADCITITDPETGEVDVLVLATRTLLPRNQKGRLQAVLIKDDDPTNKIYPIFSGNYFVDPSPWRAAE